MGASLLVLSIVVPIAGLLLAFLVGGRHVERIALATIAIGFIGLIFAARLKK